MGTITMKAAALGVQVTWRFQYFVTGQVPLDLQHPITTTVVLRLVMIQQHNRFSQEWTSIAYNGQPDCPVYPPAINQAYIRKQV